MSDLEMTRLCAEAMGYSTVLKKGDHVHVMPLGPTIDGIYWPLDNDAQAMALVKRFGLNISQPDSNGWWEACRLEDCFSHSSKDLNRAIVECVAKMHVTK